MWQFYFITVAKWLMHFTEFEKLDMEVKLTILQTVWHVWQNLDHQRECCWTRQMFILMPRGSVIIRLEKLADFSEFLEMITLLKN
ncbi:hypothetical protein L3Y34_007140 [Caenorhabditis briggsae]|uniref:NR LBD domain-containing protein n=1 Tax=Caenorhabditis briggsae TaxID=6238 RepID=A0AAE9A5R0_CAEBR|nr:hypothetical protein L3Y34_007140 [Caenorhabditis briggsae]